jgi:hypothetical protein
MKKSEKMTEALRCFRELAGRVSYEPREIALQEVFIYLVDRIALSFQPLGKLLSGSQIVLDTTRCISFLV